MPVVDNFFLSTKKVKIFSILHKGFHKYVIYLYCKNTVFKTLPLNVSKERKIFCNSKYRVDVFSFNCEKGDTNSRRQMCSGTLAWARVTHWHERRRKWKRVEISIQRKKFSYVTKALQWTFYNQRNWGSNNSCKDTDLKSSSPWIWNDFWF